MANSDYTKRGNGPLCTTATLDATITPLQTAVTITALDSAGTGSRFVGMAAMIDDEIVRVDAYTDTTLLLTRGCADTIPATHTSGAVVWFFDGAVGTDKREYVAGETVGVKVLPYTPSRESLAVNKAPPHALTFNQRFARPYPPGNVKVDGNVWTEPSLLNADHPAVTLTWAHRDRLVQADTLVGHGDGNIGPEPGVQYRLRLMKPDNSQVAVREFSGTSFEYTSAMAAIDFGLTSGASLEGHYAMFESLRADLASYQAYRINFIGEGASGGSSGGSGLGQTLGQNLGGGGVLVIPPGTPGEPATVFYTFGLGYHDYGPFSNVVNVDGDYVYLSGDYEALSPRSLTRVSTLGVTVGSPTTNASFTPGVMYFDNKVFATLAVLGGMGPDADYLGSFNKTTLASIATWPATASGDLQSGICNDGTNVWVTEHFSKNLVKIDPTTMDALSSYHVDEGVDPVLDRLRSVMHDSGFLYFHTERSIYRWSVLGFQSYRINQGCKEMALHAGKLFTVSTDGVRVYTAADGAQINYITNVPGSLNFSTIDKPLVIDGDVWIRHDEVLTVGPYAGVPRARFLIVDGSTGFEISRANNRPGFLIVADAVDDTFFLNDINVTTGDTRLVTTSVALVDDTLLFQGSITRAASPPVTASRSTYLIGVGNPITGITSPVPSGTTFSLVFAGSTVVSNTLPYDASSSTAIGLLVNKVNDSAIPALADWLVTAGSSVPGWLGEARGPLGVDVSLGSYGSGQFTVPISKIGIGVAGSLVDVPQQSTHFVQKSITSTITPGTVLTLTLDGVDYSVTSVIGSNKNSLGDALVAAVNAGGVYTAATITDWLGSTVTYGFTVTSLTGNLPYTIAHSIT